jgi:hypothetical protein
MTSAALDETATVGDLLFGGMPVEPTDALAESLHEHGAVKPFVTGAPGLAAVVEREVATEVGGLLSLDLLDLVSAGWSRYKALKEAARRTRDAPETEEVVAMATHRIESSHHPTVELFIDGKSVGTIEVELDVTFDIAEVLAVVREGRLTEIRSGNCKVTGTLAVEGIVVAERRHKFDLPGAVGLRHGVALLQPAASTAPFEHSVVSDDQSASAPAAWYPDPTRRYEFRWWDQSRWTEQVATQGRVMSDPVVCDPVPSP